MAQRSPSASNLGLHQSNATIPKTLETFGLTTGSFEMSEEALQLQSEVDGDLQVDHYLPTVQKTPSTDYHCVWFPSHRNFIDQVFKDIVCSAHALDIKQVQANRPDAAGLVLREQKYI